MGLKMRDTFFYGVEPAQVFDVYSEFWAGLGHPLIVLHHPNPRQDFNEFDLYEPNNGWTRLAWNAGWEWDVRRQAQMHVSQELHCAGLLTFVDDGDYWGYELFRDGVALDHFVQIEEKAAHWFPGCNCRGRPDILAAVFPWVSVSDAAAYLVQDPTWGIDESAMENATEMYASYWRLDVPARPGDEFTRFDECALLDFWRLLGITVEIRDGYVTTPPPIWRTFEVRDFDKLEQHRV